MHELAIAEALIEQAEEIRRANGARRVRAVRLLVGPLSGVVPALLESAFPLAAAGTALEGATLDCIATPIRVRCQTCAAQTEAHLNALVCGACGDWRTQIISGDALILERLELEIDD